MDWEFMQRVIINLIDGLWITLALIGASMVIGNVMAVPVALARVSNNPLLWIPSYAYILFFRGTPLIVQMFMIYYGMAQFREVRTSALWPLLRDPYFCAILALSLNTAAYSGEVLRGAIQAVPRGLNEAASSLGLRPWLTMRLVTLPIALRYCLPALANETVLLMKATAIVFTITVRDVMGEADILRAQTFRVYEPLLTAALLYLVLTFIIVRIFRYIERRMGVSVRREPSPLEVEAR